MNAQTGFVIFLLLALIGVALLAGRNRRTPADREAMAGIVSALNREYPLEGPHIDVKCFDGKAILGGVVREAEHRRRAGEIALSVPGVRSVDNRITIRSGG